jgi:hypothetical protein
MDGEIVNSASGYCMSDEPPGRIQEDWDDVALNQAIGKFIVQFSQLEFIIRHLLGALLDLADEQFNIITASYDFTTLCRVTNAFIISLPDCDAKLAAHANETFKKCLKVNEERVRIAHGTWTLQEGATHMSRNTFKVTSHFSKPEEIEKKTEEVKKCMTGIVHILTGKPEDRAEIARRLPMES